MTSEKLLPSQQVEDSMHAARLQSTPSVCRYYKFTGTCRYKQCAHQHVRQALPEGSFSGSSNLPLAEERHWCLSSSGSSDDECPVEVEPWRFSLLSYNILADKYAKHYRSYLYDNVPSTYLDWHHRRSVIVAELAHLQPDIICLQEVDKYEELEAELEQLGYAGIYLQRDGGRRDGCATFWRTSLLKPALIRQLRYSQYDLKDNVALLVLFEPHSIADAALSLQQHALQQQQEQPALCNNVQLQQQERQEVQERQQHKQDLLSQWLPRSWRNSSSSGNASSTGHQHSSKSQLKPAAQLQGESLYKLPSEVLSHRSRSWAGNLTADPGTGPSPSSSPGTSTGSMLGGMVPGPSASSSSSSSSSKFARLTSSRNRTAVVAAHGSSGSPAGEVVAAEPLQVAPEWHRCGLLVANTHIIFTPEKGEVKLGQARMLVQEAAQMADWYLQQQQQQQQQQTADADTAAAVSADSSSSSSKRMPRGVATIIAGDFNATPLSPTYTFLSRGLIDLRKVNKRNVSHMGSGGSSHAKGYRGYRRKQKRNSIEQQRQSLEQQQQQQQQQHLAGLPADADAEQNDGSGQLQTNIVAVASSSSGLAGAVPVASTAAASAVADSSSLAAVASQASTSPNMSTLAAAGTVPTDNSNASITRHTFSTEGSSSSSSGYHHWSDKEVRRAAGMSYDELLESSAEVAPHSPGTKIARAAAAFGARVAAGAGAAAASLAAAAAAELREPFSGCGSGTGTPAANGWCGEQQLLLRHSLQLKSCYQSVLGREPDYTSSHSQFMDTCDYVWFTETPLTLKQQQQQHKSHSSSNSSSSSSNAATVPAGSKAQAAPSAGAVGSSSSSRPAAGGSGEGSTEGCGLGYELRPVAVLMPPDGMRLTKGLPSRWLGSDHVCLVADFELTLKEL